MKILLSAAVLFAGHAFAAEVANPLIAASNAFYGQMKTMVLRSADKMPEENYKFRTSPYVRTFGEVLAHISGSQFLLCGIVDTGKAGMKDFEKTATAKAQIVKALNEGFAYCDAQYGKLTDADAPTMVNWFGKKTTKLSVMDFNIAHGFEHYGNLVTYMRIKGIVPPSSEAQK